MKKLIVGLLAAFLMSTGFIAFAGAPSQAAACPYTGCAPTNVFLTAPTTTKPKQVKFTVRVKGGNSQPAGRLSLSVRGPGVNYSKSVSAAYNPANFFVKLSRKGSYRVVAKFTPFSGSSYRASSRTKTVRVS